jgi:ubiquinone/menaquinone biosynthesis C-methylase UbiE
MDNEYWQKYYENNTVENGIPTPSPFALFVKSRLPKAEFVLDYGCGNGRDTYYFGQHHTCIGLDPANKPPSTDWAVFYKQTLQEYNHIGEPFDLIYSRFSLHSVPEEEENYFLKFASNNCQYIAIECRTKNDKLNDGTDRIKTDYATEHYRRFIDMNELEQKLIKLGFRIIYSEESTEFAPYKGTKPSCLRIIAIND